MNTRSSKLVRFLSILGLAVLAVGPRASAQTPAELNLQLYVGLTITGAVGTVYSIEYVADLVQTNTPSAWRCLEFMQLPASPYLWADKSAPRHGSAVLPSGGVCCAHEAGVHAARRVSDMAARRTNWTAMAGKVRRWR
jgi:hypothetical protein